MGTFFLVPCTGCLYLIYFLCGQTVNFKDRSSDIHQTWRGKADHRSCSSGKLYLSFCRPYLRVMDLFNPNGKGLKRDWSRASTFESPCDRYEEWIDQVSIVTVYSMILGLLWIQKRYLKSIFLVTKNSPPKTDPSTCVWLHMSTGLLDEPTLIWEMVGWPLQKPGRHVQLSVGIRKSTEVLLWSRMLEGLSFDLSTLPSHSHPPKMFFPDKIRAS